MDRAAGNQGTQGGWITICVPAAITWAALAVLAPTATVAQTRDTIPHASYFVAIDELYSGEYRDAERDFRREVQHGVKTVQARWIDSICYHAMLGEVLFQEGRNAEALAEFDQACQLMLAYPDWLLRVKFQQPPRPDPNLARRVLPWGHSDRKFPLGTFPGTEQVFIGQLDNSRVAREGGVVALPQFWRVNVIEIIRASALAMRRRNEILGPLARHDPIAKELADVFSRGGLAPTNHWSSVWVDLQRGIALAGVGKTEEAAAMLDRALILDGQFDHPLTCVALLEQGRLAFGRGDGRRAGPLLAEAGFSAYYYDNWDVLTESLWLGWMNHVATGGQGVYPPLAPAAAWAQTNRLQHIATKLRLAEAESLLWLNQLPQAVALLEDTTRRMGDMRNGLPGIHQLYLQAVVQLLQGRVEQSGELLEQSLSAQAGASLRNFQITHTNNLYDARQVSPRIAEQLYEALLADPGPVDWALQPLDAMAVLRAAHDAAFDRWFHAAVERKEVARMIEVAEQAKRRRFLASLPLGGRLLALRTILESPVSELSNDAVLQRQQFLASLPQYGQLATEGQKLYEVLRAGPVLAGEGKETKPLNEQYDAWGENAQARERLLFGLALRRVPTALDFPPLQKTAELQEALGEGEAILVFHATGGDLSGFLVTRSDTHHWSLSDFVSLRSELGKLLQALGNYGPNRTLSVADLKREAWREAASKVFERIFADARLDLDKTKSLVIVPDGLLWYLPFELLVPPDAEPSTVLVDRVPVRYAPLAALAVGKERPLRRVQHTGIVANELAADDTSEGGAAVLQELGKIVPGSVRLPSPMPEPSELVAPLLDTLIVLDDVEPLQNATGGEAFLPRTKGRPSGTLHSWIGLPYGGPQRIVVTGLATAAEQGLKTSRRHESDGVQPGSEMFLTVCMLMANDARTILLSRWRTSGRTNFDLVREFVQELPNASATDAWRRATVLAREAPLDVSREPRLKRQEDSGELPTADHPFFWGGYLLVDMGLPPEKERAETEKETPDEGKAKKEQEQAKTDVAPAEKNANPAAPPPDEEKTQRSKTDDKPGEGEPEPNALKQRE